MRILLLCSLLIISGCSWFSSTPAVHQLGTESFAIPVTPSKFIEDVQQLGTQGFEAKNIDNAPEMIITIPASDKPTVVEVRKAKRTIVDRALTNKPAYVVESNNPGIKAAQPKQTVWWKWIAVGVGCLFVVAMAAMVIAQKVASFSPWGSILSLFKRRTK